MPAAKKTAPRPALTVAYATTVHAQAAARRSAIPDGISHQAAQAELNAALFPHYLLGRQLALEETVRELLLALPDSARAAVVDRLTFHANEGIERIQDGIADPHDDAATCGYVCALLQQGM